MPGAGSLETKKPTDRFLNTKIADDRFLSTKTPAEREFAKSKGICHTIFLVGEKSVMLRHPINGTGVSVASLYLLTNRP